MGRRSRPDQCQLTNLKDIFYFIHAFISCLFDSVQTDTYRNVNASFQNIQAVSLVYSTHTSSAAVLFKSTKLFQTGEPLS